MVETQQDDFDLDAILGDLGEDDGTGDGGDSGQSDQDKPKYTKLHVQKAVEKRLERERARIESQFQEVYGMKPEDVLEHGKREIARYTAAQAQASMAPGDAANPNVQQQQVDPVEARFNRLEASLAQRDAREQQVLEAQEFLQKYPGIKFKDIPQEVLLRRARGGVSLAEAYRLHMADKEVQDAARQAAENAARGITSRQRFRAEGPDHTGGATDDSEFLAEDEREFARAFGMVPKRYLAAKQKAKVWRESQS